MFKLKRSLITATVLSVLLGVTCVRTQTPEVLAQRAGDAVRVSASGEVSALRLEVFARDGGKLFDSQTVPGELLDWPLLDKSGARLKDATYDYTLTVTYRSGLARLSGQVELARESALLRPQVVTRVGPTGEVLEQTAVGDSAVLDNTSGGLFQFDLLGESERPALTFQNPLPAPIFTSSGGRAVVARGCCDGQGGGALVAQFGNGPPLDTARQVLLAHDSADGRLVIRGGALRFSTGNFFDGTDVERLRLTGTGDVGIGVTNPTAKLEVAGEIKGAMITTPVLNALTQYNLGGVRILANPGTNNLFAGESAGAANTTGASNAFVGANAGQANTTGSSNTFVGSAAGFSNTTGSLNAFFGVAAGRQNTSGSFNAFFGVSAGFGNTTGSRNAYFGYNAGQANTTGSENAFFGAAAGLQNTTGSNNAFFGHNAGVANMTGTANAFFGASSGLSNTTGFNNSFFGRDAGHDNTTGSSNSFFGRSAGFNNISGFGNSFFGTAAGVGNSSGDNNSFFGVNAGQFNTTADNNSFFGAEAGRFNTTGTFNSFFGHSAGRSNTTACCNSFFGYQAGQENTTGAANSFYGYLSGSLNTIGLGNSFFGDRAGLNNANGVNNSFFGRDAGRSNTTGSYSAYFGYNAGNASTTGFENAFFGADAGESNSSGDNNSFFGRSAGGNNTTGSGNTFIGRRAGVSNTTGTSNTAIGEGANVGAGNLHHATAIGAGARVNHSNNVVIGRDSDVVEIPGLVNNPLRLAILPIAEGLQLCQSDGSFGTVAGSVVVCGAESTRPGLRHKTAIKSFTGGLNIIDSLRPITFTWRDRPATDIGLAAEEVAIVEPLLVTHNSQGDVEGVKYDQIVVVLINAIKQQQQQILQLKKLYCADHPNAQACQ